LENLFASLEQTIKRTLIIAEAGVNHNGNIDLAHKLIDAAADAKADAVKFQTFRAEGVATDEAPKAEYQIRTTGSDENQLSMIRQLELSPNHYPDLINHCAQRNIIFLSTPHDWEAIEILDKFDVPAFKIGSGDLTNIPFLKAVALKDRPIILSTGMGNLSEVEEAVNTVKSQNNSKLILLHCVTSYPAKPEDCNLNAITTLRQAFQVPVGYSDHTIGLEIPLAAVSLGATVIEKHFTLDRKLPGPDHEASLEPSKLSDMIQSIRIVETALGNGIKYPTPVEHGIKVVARKSIVAAKDIPINTIIMEDMITTKRPGNGLLPRYWSAIIGCTTKCDISQDALIRWEQISTAEGIN
jgi:N-acetylneuraminate synthase/N,N'-diacetyllegionaminate synthase